MSAAEQSGADIRLRLYIQPRASRDSWVALWGDEIKVAITAPPVDGKANAHLIKFVAKSFAVAKSAVILEKGELGRHKVLRVQGAKALPELVKTLLNAH